MSGRLFTIGHSNHELEHFIGLLKQHAVEAVVDVRSHPSSQYATHFDSLLLKPALEAAGIKYAFLGHELGGRPPGDEFYDDQGYVLYDKAARRPEFLLGIRRLENAVGRMRLAIMCSEEDPTECHRRLLVGRVLVREGIGVDHIRGDGRIQTEEELTGEERRGDGQLSLFPEPEGDTEWKSTRSVSPKRRPSASSKASSRPASADFWTSA
ncbi:MAG TPA: DUF488 domain-containing protein [Phycisphaerae bacterium]|nr:DUF488 domain-containing protein [Phycisphaerae bacterium]